MRRISFLLPDLRGGGAERLSLTLAHEFARAGYGAEFVLMQAEGELLDEARASFPVHDLGGVRTRQVPRPLSRYLRSHQPDALIAAMWPLTVIAPVVARMARFRGKVLISEHITLSQQYADWGRLHGLALRASTFAAYRLASARVGVSRGVCADIAALSGVPLNRFVTIYNPVPEAVAPSPQALADAEAIWDNDGPRILTVGNLKLQKNHALLLRAFAALPRGDARLMLLGRGDNEAGLRALAEELGVATRVIFAGFHRDPAPFYATADLFALSSDYEGLPLVLVEALSFGLPAVSTDCPSGPAEVLEGGRLGRLVPVGDAPALARAMDEALNAPVDCEALIRRAGEFAPAIIARQYLDLLGL
jgi:glycosyltransferase involved in cell wall biosynthesis